MSEFCRYCGGTGRTGTQCEAPITSRIRNGMGDTLREPGDRCRNSAVNGRYCWMHQEPDKPPASTAREISTALAASLMLGLGGVILVLGFLEFWFGFRPAFMDACLVEDCTAYGGGDPGLYILAGGLIVPVTLIFGLAGLLVHSLNQRRTKAQDNGAVKSDDKGPQGGEG